MANATGKAAIARAFVLLTECCRQGLAGGDSDRLKSLAAGADWDLLLALARRHRVEGLAAHSLRPLTEMIPSHVADSLDEAAVRIARDGLVTMQESRCLFEAFERAAVPLLFVKGVTLARLAYGNPFLKMGWDIDLLVAPPNVSRAAFVLKEIGYRLVIPSAADPNAAVAWHRSNKESVWQSGDRRHHVELHSRLADNKRVIPTITVEAPQQMVEVAPGVRLPTLAREELFAYLTVHGSASNWFRLKWAADLAGLVNGCDGDELTALVQRAQALGAGRSTAQAMLLCAALFGEPFRAVARRLGLARGPVNRWLAASARAELCGSHALQEPTERRLGTARIHLTHLALGFGWTYPLAELTRKIAEQADRRRFR
ncbi:MAG: nucleotidyltransferase family protein [Sphingomicrobium sp.]|nr:nucleotidyltransferase family protein [Sphingomonadales bacterium]